MNKNLFKIGSLAVVAIVMASCAKTDLYDENSEILISQHKKDYQANFVKKYGDVDPNMSWDLSSHQPTYSLTSMHDAPKRLHVLPLTLRQSPPVLKLKSQF